MVLGDVMSAQGRLIGGRYRLAAEIGRGGSGVVWRAFDARLGREVAVKELAIPPLSTAAERSAMVGRAMQEARTAGKLDHPNIVAVYDVVEDSGHPCIVMRLVRGFSLDEVVAATGPLPADIAARIGLTVLDALAEAHRAGVVHRDVKPANVLVQPDGTVLLTDFSIASVLGTGSRTAAGVLLGTPGYIAPERLTHGTAGPPADLFALGATLYLAVEGTEAFDIGDALSGLFAVATAPHRPPERAGALAPILDHLLAKGPDERPDAEAAAEALRTVAAPDGRSLAALLAATPALAAATRPGTSGHVPAGPAAPGGTASGPFPPGSAPVPGATPTPGPPLRPTTVAPVAPWAAPQHPPAGASPPGGPWGGVAPHRPPGAQRGLRQRIAALPPVAFVAAGTVLLLVLALTAYALVSSGGKDPGLTTSTDRTASASPTPTASPTPSPPSGLSSGEQALWTTLRGRGIDKASCRSGPDPDGTDVDATLVCDTVGAPQTQVRYFTFRSDDDYRDHFSELDDYDGDGAAHNCDTAGNEGYGDWNQNGTVACYWTGRGTWWITWGDRDALVGAEIQDTDPNAVATWWRQNNALTA